MMFAELYADVGCSEASTGCVLASQAVLTASSYRTCARLQRCQGLAMHGAGVYADLDFESLRNLEDVLAGQQVVLAEMTEEDWDQAIPNAWLASEKGHPFWLFCIQQIIKASGSCSATNTDR